MVMARWYNTQAVGLLLTPDVRRRSHPSVDLEPEARPLGDLQDSTNPASCPLLNLTPGAFIRWRA
jgi:3,4-dihydroxy 2-butanone 4-phosphate synthase/GTP cyclohydrolase II